MNKEAPHPSEDVAPSRLMRWLAKLIAGAFAFGLGAAGMWLVFELWAWAYKPAPNAAALTEPPIAMPSDIEPDQCIYDFSCSLAAFLQVAVTGSTVEPSDEWAVSKWSDGPVAVAVYGLDNIAPAHRDLASNAIDSVIDIHNRSGADIRRAGPDEQGDVNVFFTDDPRNDSSRFREESGLLLFGSVYRLPPGEALCWEQSLEWKHDAGKELSAIVIPANRGEAPEFVLLRCIIEELTHALSPLRHDLDVPAATFFLNDGNISSKWVLTLSPLDRMMLLIGYHPAIKSGDDLLGVIGSFETVYPTALATYCQTHDCDSALTNKP